MNKFSAGRWSHIPLIPAFGRQRQANLFEFEASMVYKSSFLDRLQSCIETLFQKRRKEGRKEGRKKGKKEGRKEGFLCSPDYARTHSVSQAGLEFRDLPPKGWD